MISRRLTQFKSQPDNLSPAQVGYFTIYPILQPIYSTGAGKKNSGNKPFFGESIEGCRGGNWGKGQLVEIYLYACVASGSQQNLPGHEPRETATFNLEPVCL